MSDPMAEIRASFFIECEELLEAMQDGLQALDDGETDSETINVVFRAVHSIKGGAGAFGLNELVSFAHTFETALDGVRSGTIAVDHDTLKIFFQGGDVLADHVRAARDDEPLDPAAFAEVLDAIRALSGEEEGADDEEEDLDFQPMGVALDLPDLDLDLPEPAGRGPLAHRLHAALAPLRNRQRAALPLPRPARPGRAERHLRRLGGPDARRARPGHQLRLLVARADRRGQRGGGARGLRLRRRPLRPHRRARRGAGGRVRPAAAARPGHRRGRRRHPGPGRTRRARARDRSPPMPRRRTWPRPRPTSCPSRRRRRPSRPRRSRPSPPRRPSASTSTASTAW